MREGGEREGRAREKEGERGEEQLKREGAGKGRVGDRGEGEDKRRREGHY